MGKLWISRACKERSLNLSVDRAGQGVHYRHRGYVDFVLEARVRPYANLIGICAVVGFDVCHRDKRLTIRTRGYHRGGVNRLMSFEQRLKFGGCNQVAVGAEHVVTAPQNPQLTRNDVTRGEITRPLGAAGSEGWRRNSAIRPSVPEKGPSR